MKRSPTSETQHPNERTKSEAANDLPVLASLERSVSPPLKRVVQTTSQAPEKTLSESNQDTLPSLAAIEAGEIKITDHLGIISEKLQDRVHTSDLTLSPRLLLDEWKDLYRRNAHPKGRHFVIHQHDHPVAGPHYDLRLQFSETSSVSWSIMYGLPGDPNSERLNRNATETRIHCLWVSS
jgi:hypothetical protein